MAPTLSNTALSSSEFDLLGSVILDISFILGQVLRGHSAIFLSLEKTAKSTFGCLHFRFPTRAAQMTTLFGCLLLVVGAKILAFGSGMTG